MLGASGDIWNEVTGNITGLKDSLGSATTINLGFATAGFGFNNLGGTATMDPATIPLMQDYYFGTTTISLSGLTAFIGQAFTLVAFGAGDGTGQGTTFSITAGATGGNSASSLATTGAS